jgi:hypothetical protein
MGVLKFCCFFLLILSPGLFKINAQNYIGMDKDEIIKDMNASHRSFKLNTSAVNPYYKYLKFEDNINEITILFFLSDSDKCTLVRKMCDYANINDEIKDLNQKYKKLGKNKWTYSEKGKFYSVTLEESEWYFTISTKQKN